MGLRERATAANAADGAAPPAPSTSVPASAGDLPAWRVPPKSKCSPQGITACDLLAMEFDPPRYLIRDLLTEGLTIFGGKPKHGKSWLALLMGWAVAAGEPVDGREAWQGDVLYLALEDTRRRLQGRISKLRGALGWTVPETLTLCTPPWPRADDGGLYHIAEWLDSRKKTARLVIIDTLAKFRRPQKGTGNSYADDYEAVGGFKELLDHYGVAGLFLHHTRKLRSDDPFDEISGTQAIAGAADSILVLDTQEKGGAANLFVTGRDIADATIPMSFAQDSGRWVLSANADGVKTEGRADGTSKATGKLDQCKAWLKDFLREYAYPSAEIDAAGKVAGFSPGTIRDAKAALGKQGTRDLVHRNFGGGGRNDWWSGTGPSDQWKRRPTQGSGPEIPD